MRQRVGGRATAVVVGALVLSGVVLVARPADSQTETSTTTSAPAATTTSAGPTTTRPVTTTIAPSTTVAPSTTATTVVEEEPAPTTTRRISTTTLRPTTTVARSTTTSTSTTTTTRVVVPSTSIALGAPSSSVPGASGDATRGDIDRIVHLLLAIAGATAVLGALYAWHTSPRRRVRIAGARAALAAQRLDDAVAASFVGTTVAIPTVAAGASGDDDGVDQATTEDEADEDEADEDDGERPRLRDRFFAPPLPEGERPNPRPDPRPRPNDAPWE